MQPLVTVEAKPFNPLSFCAEIHLHIFKCFNECQIIISLANLDTHLTILSNIWIAN